MVPKAPDGDEGNAERPRVEPGQPPESRHGTTAEDETGVGYGEEGYRAEDYPGRNPVRGESEREEVHRTVHAWTWPRPSCEERHAVGEGSREDRRICEEIGRRIERAEPDLERVVVSVLDGEVVVEGTVDSLEDAHVVEGMVETIEGVRGVESRLAVEEGRTEDG